MYNITTWGEFFVVSKKDVDIDFMFSYDELSEYIKTSSENEKNIVMFNYVLISSVNIKYNTNFKLNNEEIKL